MLGVNIKPICYKTINKINITTSRAKQCCVGMIMRTNEEDSQYYFSFIESAGLSLINDCYHDSSVNRTDYQIITRRMSRDRWRHAVDRDSSSVTNAVFIRKSSPCQITVDPQILRYSEIYGIKTKFMTNLFKQHLKIMSTLEYQYTDCIYF